MVTVIMCLHYPVLVILYLQARALIKRLRTTQKAVVVDIESMPSTKPVRASTLSKWLNGKYVEAYAVRMAGASVMKWYATNVSRETPPKKPPRTREKDTRKRKRKRPNRKRPNRKRPNRNRPNRNQAPSEDASRVRHFYTG